jgi:hypothetical protein
MVWRGIHRLWSTHPRLSHRIIVTISESQKKIRVSRVPERIQHCKAKQEENYKISSEAGDGNSRGGGGRKGDENGNVYLFILIYDKS